MRKRKATEREQMRKIKAREGDTGHAHQKAREGDAHQTTPTMGLNSDVPMMNPLKSQQKQKTPIINAEVVSCQPLYALPPSRC